MLLISDFLKGLKEVRVFLLLTKMYPMRFLWGLSPSLVHLK